MRARTASSFTSLALGAAAFGAWLSVACSAPAPAPSPGKAAAPVALCPATMKGEGTKEFPLSGLSIIRIETGKGSGNVAPTGDASRREWALPPAQNVRYRAVCEYDEEVIGVPIDSAIRHCWLARKPGGEVVTTWCES